MPEKGSDSRVLLLFAAAVLFAVVFFVRPSRAEDSGIAKTASETAAGEDSSELRRILGEVRRGRYAPGGVAGSAPETEDLENEPIKQN